VQCSQVMQVHTEQYSTVQYGAVPMYQACNFFLSWSHQYTCLILVQEAFLAGSALPPIVTFAQVMCMDSHAQTLPLPTSCPRGFVAVRSYHGNEHYNSVRNIDDNGPGPHLR